MRGLAPAVELIKKWEGCVLHTYKDVVGVNTIGWGHCGPEAVPGRKITQSEADALLLKDLEKFKTKIEESVHVPCSNNEFCALVSFAFNVGIGALQGSTLLREFNQGLSAQVVSNQFLLWVHAGGHVLEPLVRRRHDERALFLCPDAPARPIVA